MKPLSLHDACYVGDLARVRELLAAGANPNARAEPADDRHTWVTCAGDRPRPLNCVVVARSLGSAQVEIARALISHGALVDDTVIRDHAVESVGSASDMALHRLLTSAR